MHAVTGRLLDGIALLLGLTCLVPALFLGLFIAYEMTLHFFDGREWSYRLSGPDQMSLWMPAAAMIASPGIAGLLTAWRGREWARVSMAGTAIRFAVCGLVVDGLLLIAVPAILNIKA